jgi:hypothetical protein
MSALHRDPAMRRLRRQTPTSHRRKTQKTARKETVINNTTEIATIQGVGLGWMRVATDGCSYTFHVGGNTRTLLVSSAEAVALAQQILQREGSE